MKLFNLIELRFSPEILENKKNYEYIKNKIKNIKMHNLLNLNKELFDKYIIFVTENYIISKTTCNNSNFDLSININYEELNNLTLLEFELPIINYQQNNEHNIQIGLSNNANLNLDNYDPNNSYTYYDENYVNNNYQINSEAINNENINNDTINSDTINNDTINNDTINSENSNNINFVKIKLRKVKYIQLHIFLKNYNVNKKDWDDNCLKYNNTIIIDDSLICEDYLNVHFDQNNHNDSNIGSLDFDNTHFYDTYYYKNFNDFYFINNYYILSNYNNLNEEQIINLFGDLKKIFTGFYFSSANICLQILLKLFVLSYTNFTALHSFNFKKYKLGTIKESYYNNYESSYIENILINNTHIICDVCGKNIASNNAHVFYHHNVYGDLCVKCYKNKETHYNNVKSIFINLIKNYANNINFKKELENTKRFLKNKKIKKLSNDKHKSLIMSINKNLLSNFESKINFCNICYDVLKTNIFVANNCGHCFHEECVKQLQQESCPYCRINCKFVKLYYN